MGLLSRLAEQVTFVLMPPLILIFLVLGTIFLGVATPTEGGAMGALGALILAVSRKRLDKKLMNQALENTAKLASFVLFILIGSTVFSFTFNAADGHIWVEHLFLDMPGGAIGFLIVVNILIFILGCFIDFFEIAFIVIPILAPVAEKILPGMVPGMTADQAMIWFGVIVAMNLQTSFLTPPFGFALFYLRSVAPKNDYKDRITGENIPAVKTSEIYKGSIAFIVLQLIMVAAIIAFPNLVTGGLKEGVKIDADAAFEQMADRAGDEGSEDPAASLDDPKPEEDGTVDPDPAKALEADMKASKK
jgi:tripartite ATP-independent transporter DctM subunit